MSKRQAALGCVIALCVGTAIVTGGCGDDAGNAADDGEQSVSWANEPPRVFIERMAKLLGTTKRAKECRELNDIYDRSLVRIGCPPAKSVARSMRRFKVVGAAEYGTGAVVDYKSGRLEDGAAIVMFVTPDRNWGISQFGILTKPSVRTSDRSSRRRFEDAAERYVDAVRKRDCKALTDVAYAAGRPSSVVCKTSFGSLTKRLKANPEAAPRYRGGNRTYGFLTLETSKPRLENSTISVAKSGAGAKASYVVLDVTPSATSADQRRTVQGARKAREQTDEEK